MLLPQAFACAVMSQLVQALSVWLAILALQGSAAAQDWVVKRVSGVTWLLAQGVAPTALAAGETVPKGYTVITGRNGRAMLADGEDTMILGPNSKIAVPYRPDAGMSATVWQQLGSINLSVGRRQTPHFSVETPFLAAVVKGTKFTVVVSGEGAEVMVRRGVVGIADLATGQHADIPAGRRAASWRKKPGLQVSGVGVLPTVEPGRPQAAVLAPAPATTTTSDSVGSASESAASDTSPSVASDTSASASSSSSAANAKGKSASSKGNPANSNAGGNGNGNSANSNAGGNGNGNSANSNAGGNGKGNSGG